MLTFFEFFSIFAYDLFYMTMAEDCMTEDNSAMTGTGHVLEGIVVHGQQLGRKIGYPTANLGLETLKGGIPATGVYAARCILQDGRQYKAMLNVGYRPTVDSDGSLLSIEAHILGFDEDIYGQWLKLVVVRRIRDERKMGSLAELSAQLSKDLLECYNSLV